MFGKKKKKKKKKKLLYNYSGLYINVSLLVFLDIKKYRLLLPRGIETYFRSEGTS